MNRMGVQNDSFLDKVYKALKDSPMIIIVWLIFLAMFVAGIFVFYEDTLSSKFGNEWIAQTYGVIPFSSEFMKWVIALIPQIAQMGGSYILLAYSGNKGGSKGDAYVKMATIMTPVFLLMDIGSDIFYRSNALASPVSIGIGVIYSLTYYTIGSEIFLVLGFTFTVLLMPPAIGQIGKIAARIVASFVFFGQSLQLEWENAKRENQRSILETKKAQNSEDLATLHGMMGENRGGSQPHPMMTTAKNNAPVAVGQNNNGYVAKHRPTYDSNNRR